MPARRRLHLIIGDANLRRDCRFPQAGQRRASCISMIEADVLGPASNLRLADPSEGVRRSRTTPSLTQTVETRRRAPPDRRSTSSRPISMPPGRSSTTGIRTDAEPADAARAVAEAAGRPRASIPLSLADTPRLGRQAGAARAVPRARRSRLGPTRSWPSSTCSTPTCGRSAGSTTGSWATRADAPPARRRRDRRRRAHAARGHACMVPRRVHPPVRATTSWLRPGTRWCSTPARGDRAPGPTLDPLRGTRELTTSCWTDRRRCSSSSPARRRNLPAGSRLE